MAQSTNDPNRLITLAIHSYDRAVMLKRQLAEAGVPAVLHNVNLQEPLVSTGVRVRIHEKDLPLALKVVESETVLPRGKKQHRSMGKVLVPVDFSGYSLKACKIGFAYAKRIAGQVVVMHAFSSESHRFFLPFGSDLYGNGDQDDKTMRAAATLKMKNFKSQLEKNIMRGEVANVPFDTIISEGLPEQCVLQYAQKIDTPLIVMGTHGAHQQEHAAIGSVTAEVVDEAKFPVFTVPENMALSDLSQVRHVAFFSNLNPQDILSFDTFTRLLDINGLDISIIPVVEKRDAAYLEKATSQLMQYCTEHYTQCRFRLEPITLDDDLVALQQYMTDRHVDLIAVPNRKRNIVSRLFNPSIAHKVLFQSDVPMIVVPV